MSQSSLRHHIARLRSELSQAPVDQRTAESIALIIADIERMEADERPVAQPLLEQLHDRLRSSVVGFETEHPRVSAIVEDILAKLGAMGV
jgi:hypothetical protein